MCSAENLSNNFEIEREQERRSRESREEEEEREEREERGEEEEEEEILLSPFFHFFSFSLLK